MNYSFSVSFSHGFAHLNVQMMFKINIFAGFHSEMLERFIQVVGIHSMITESKDSIEIFGRFTLLLGPPGSGKTTLLRALSGKVDPELKVVRYFKT